MKRGPGKRDRAEILHDLFTATGIVPASSLAGQPPSRSPLDIKADRRRAAKGQAPTDDTAAEYDGVEPADWLAKPARELHLRDYQKDAEDSIFREWQDNRGTMAIMATGTGKCLGRGTPVLMYDGTVRPVESVGVGDLLMGPDSRPRRVVSLARGRETMYRVTPKRYGDPFVCNESHILSLKWTGEGRERSGRVAGQVVNVSVRDYLTTWGKTQRHVAKAWRAPVSWPAQPVDLPPYFLGVWLGDGCVRIPAVTTTDSEIVRCVEAVASAHDLRVRREENGGRCPIYHVVGSKAVANPVTKFLDGLGLIQNKHIPHVYRVNSEAVRLDVLAGLIDTDGHYDGGCYTIVQKLKRLADDIVFLARSLGFGVSVRRVFKECTNSDTNAVGEYHQVTISGHLDRIPTRIPRKRAAARSAGKDVMVSGFDIESLGVGDYYGFEIAGPDRLFMLGDFTVTHNTVVATRVCQRVLDGELGALGRRFLFLAHREELITQTFDTFRAAFPRHRVEIERAGDRASRLADIVIASNQTLGRRDRLDRWEPSWFACICQDEAHHAIASNATYNGIIRHFPNAKLLGLTATPDRQDEIALGQIFDSVAFTFDIVDGVREGWLVPVGQKLEIVQDIDYSTIKLDKSGEFTDEDLARVMREEKNLYALADAAIKYSNFGNKQRSSLVFAASREHAIDVADILNAKHAARGTGRAACIHYKLEADRRKEIIAAYKRQEIRYLTNFGILCLDDQTEILTERGWLGIDDMRPDDRVANYEHVGEKAGTIFFAEPKAIVRRDRFPDERMVAVDGRRGNIRVTADHRMLFRKPRSTDAFGIVHAADCVNREGDVPVSGHAEPVPFWPVQPETPADRRRLIAANSYHLRKAGMSYADARAEAGRRLDVRLSRQYATADELSLSDCRFIGFYLAEGTRGNVAGGVEYTICQSVKNPHVVAFFDGVVEKMGVHNRRTERDGVVRWSFDRGTGSDSKGGVFHLEPWLNKDGSNLFWSLTRAQWGALIEGFWFGDGDHGQQSHMPQRFRLFNTNKSLIDWMQAVSTCRGCRATIGRAVGNVADHNIDRGHKPLYKLSMAWGVDTRGMSEQRLQFETYWTPERVWCVTSHTGNIITRRGGVVTITGNTEGFDDDETRIIVNGRPIHKNRALFSQIVGRATRPLKEILALLAAAPDAAARKAIIKASRKPGAMVVDLCGVNHKLVLNMTDLLGGHYTEEAVSIVRERIAKSNTVVDVENELEAIQRKIDEQKAEERRKRLRESVNLDVKLIGRTVNPFDLSDGVAPRGVSGPMSNAATKPQLEMLERYGVPKNEIKELTKSAARKLIDTIQVRRRMGLCTYKQANKLAQYGYDPNMTFNDARKILDALAANGWRPIELDRDNPNL